MKTEIIIFRDPHDPLYITLAISFKVFCIHVLGLKEGEFDIGWFASTRARETSNHSVHLDCNQPNLIEKIKTELPKQNFIDFIHKDGLTKIDMRVHGDMFYDFKYHIHFKVLY